MTRQRLDVALVRARLARSRTHAAALVDAGRVYVDGATATKPALAVVGAQRLEVAAARQGAQGTDRVSRAGEKLAGALDAFARSETAAPDVAGRVALDAGASTGGFTEELLRRGARLVHAVDVGHGQLAPELVGDPRVYAREGVNVRHLAPGDLDPEPDLVVGDLSFISLTLVLAPLQAVAAGGSDVVLLVKPQFEVGRERLGAGGVVRDEGDRQAALQRVLDTARRLGWTHRATVDSPLAGEHGNREFVVWWSAP